MTDTKQFTQNTNIMCISTNVEPNSNMIKYKWIL